MGLSPTMILYMHQEIENLDEIPKKNSPRLSIPRHLPMHLHLERIKPIPPNLPSTLIFIDKTSSINDNNDCGRMILVMGIKGNRPHL